MEQILTSLDIGQAQMHMGTVAGEVPKWFWHKSSPETVLLRDRTDHPFEEGVAVGGSQCIGIGPVYFELAVGILMIVRIRVPPQLLHEPQESGHHIEITMKSAQVITGLGECVKRVPGSIFSDGVLLKQHELRLYAAVRVITLLTRTL